MEDNFNGQDVDDYLEAFGFFDDEPQTASNSKQTIHQKHQTGYVVCCISPYSGKRLFYQDRQTQQQRFWTECYKKAFLFPTECAAWQYCKRLKYNHPHICRITSDGTIQKIVKQHKGGRYDAKTGYKNCLCRCMYRTD